jgi:Na+/proline symporter
MILASQTGTPLPASGDDLLPMFAATGMLGQAVVAFFAIGLIAAAFSSADSAITALTTSVCIDILRRPEDERTRRTAHLFITAAFILCIILFDHIGTSSVINAIYIMCGYTYGPILGLFMFAIFTKRKSNERFIPHICILSPIVCFLLDTLTQRLWNYHFGYELLMLNGLLTFCTVYAMSRQKT